MDEKRKARVGGEQAQAMPGLPIIIPDKAGVGEWWSRCAKEGWVHMKGLHPEARRRLPERLFRSLQGTAKIGQLVKGKRERRGDEPAGGEMVECVSFDQGSDEEGGGEGGGAAREQVRSEGQRDAQEEDGRALSGGEAQYGREAAELLADGVSCAVLLTSHTYTSAHSVARMCKRTHPLGASSRNSKSAVIRSKLCSGRTYTGPDGSGCTTRA